MLLDARGIECSTGSACDAGVPQASHVLLAMGSSEEFARSSLRFSLGHTSTEADVDRALALIPPQAPVSATNSLGAHLSARSRVLSFPYIQDAEWIAVDETRPGYADRLAPLPAAAQVVWLRRNPAWRLVFERDGVLVFHRVLPP